MRFKEWIKMTEANVRNVNAYRGPRGVTNSGTLTGSAAQFGRSNEPGWVNQATTGMLGSVGQSYRNSLMKKGLDVQGIGQIVMPNMQDKKGVEYGSLPIQTPQYAHGSTPVEERVTFNSDKIYREVFRLDPRRIRPISGPGGMQEGIAVNGKYLLLGEENSQWNYDPSRAKQFTRALIYRTVYEKLASQGDKYDLDTMPEILGEEESEDQRVLTVWFGFKPKQQPQKLKGGNP